MEHEFFRFVWICVVYRNFNMSYYELYSKIASDKYDRVCTVYNLWINASFGTDSIFKLWDSRYKFILFSKALEKKRGLQISGSKRRF